MTLAVGPSFPLMGRSSQSPAELPLWQVFPAGSVVPFPSWGHFSFFLLPLPQPSPASPSLSAGSLRGDDGFPALGSGPHGPPGERLDLQVTYAFQGRPWLHTPVVTPLGCFMKLMRCLSSLCLTQGPSSPGARKRKQKGGEVGKESSSHSLEGSKQGEPTPPAGPIKPWRRPSFHPCVCLSCGEPPGSSSVKRRHGPGLLNF